MARTYKRSVNVPMVDVLDWVLVEELDELLRPYLLDPERALLKFRANDARGDYDESSASDLRTNVEGHSERPERISIALSNWTPEGAGAHVWWGEGEFVRGAEFESPNEPDVVYLADRVGDIFGRAETRRSERLERERLERERLERERLERERPAVPHSPMPPSLGPKSTGIAAFLNHPWVVTVGGGLLIVVIVAVVVSLMH